MIPEEVAIEARLTVRHDEGLLYCVEDTRLTTNGYEETHALGELTVNYTQLEDGDYPVGTKWSKDLYGFRAHFTIQEIVELEPMFNESLYSVIRYQGEEVKAVTSTDLIKFGAANGIMDSVAARAFSDAFRTFEYVTDSGLANMTV